MSPLTGLFSDVIVGVIFIAPLALIVLDVLSGIAGSIHDQSFSLRYLSHFLGTSFLRYMTSFASLLAIWIITADKRVVMTVAVIEMGVLSLSLAASILENLLLYLTPPPDNLATYHVADQSTDKHPLVHDPSPTLEMTSVSLRRIGAMQSTDCMPAMEAI